jgi:hypothetical protein
MTPTDPTASPSTTTFQNVNEDGAVYDEHALLGPALDRLAEYPNDTVVVHGEAPTLTDIFGPPISVHTRADALADGVLVEVPRDVARAEGFLLPVAMTAAAWADTVAWDAATEARKPGAGQSETGRLADVLFLARLAVHRATGTTKSTSVDFTLARVPVEGNSETAATTSLRLVCGPGDRGEAVLTLMLPTED